MDRIFSTNFQSSITVVALGSDESRSPGIVIRRPISSNRFQSVDFAGRPPPCRAEEVRQGVDGGRRTVGSLPRCR